MKKSFLSASFGQDDVNDSWNDFAGFLNGDRIANADIFLSNVIFVMQSRAADGAARQEHRFQFGYGSQSAGAADLHRHRFEFGFRLLGGVFVGNCPAWRFGSKPSFLSLRCRPGDEKTTPVQQSLNWQQPFFINGT